MAERIELDTTPSTILVVDDDPTNLLWVRDKLQDHYHVLTANSGQRGLELANAKPRPDLILLDLIMPKMDGYQVLQKLRAMQTTRDIPVIFVTARISDKEEARGLALGAVDYMTKPLRPSILLARLRNHLEFKHARDALRNQNVHLETLVMERTKMLRAILDSVDQIIVMVTPDGNIMAINRIGAEKLNALPSHLLGRNYFNLLPPGVSAALRQRVAEAIHIGQPTALDDERDGLILHTTVFSISGDPTRVVIYTEDITNFVTAESALRREHEQLSAALVQQRQLNKKLEETQSQLVQSEKMASLGQLAAGVAHELNNPIGFVHSNLGTLDNYLQVIFEFIEAFDRTILTTMSPADVAVFNTLKQEKDLDFIRQDIFPLLAESKDGLHRVRAIVQNLKDFSRVGETHWQLADIHAGLDSTLKIVWNELKYKCTVVKHYAADLPHIYCLPSQLNQVFLNLLVNATHAIKEKGEITICTERVGTDAICIRISDTGHGIEKESMPHIFEPFFTTKPIGEGTGLGLSIAYGIVGKHQGKIDVESNIGKGTTFTITLPIRAQDKSDSA